MKVVIDGPWYFAQADEDRFFEWIYSLPAYKNVEGRGTKLHLTLGDPVDDETIKQLLVICRRWHIDISPLAPLRRRSNERFVLWRQDLATAASRPFPKPA